MARGGAGSKSKMRWNRAYRLRPDAAERIRENHKKEGVIELVRERERLKSKAMGCDSDTRTPTICKFLKKHHEEYKDDPEALSSEFIKELLGRHKDDCSGNDAP